MDGFSTLTQKGQVAIPKAIRDYFNLKASDKLYFSIDDNKIVAEPVQGIEEMRGIVKSHKFLAKKEYKKIVKDAILEKFERKNS